MTELTKVVPLTCHGHSRPVTHISFSAITEDDQSYLISACKDNNPMLRDGITGDWIGTFIGHKGAVWQARLSEDAKLAVTGSADFSAKVWDTETGEALATFPHLHIVRAVAFPSQPSPQLVATGGAEKKLRVFDLNRSISSSHTHLTGIGNGSANGSDTPSSNQTVNKPSNGSHPTPGQHEVELREHPGTIRSIIWSPIDPNVLITAAEDQKIRWWDLRMPDAISEFQVDGVLGSCELNTADTSLASNNVLASERHIVTVAATSKIYFLPPTPTTNSQSASDSSPIKTHTVLESHPAVSAALNIAARKFVTGGGGDTWVRTFDYDSGEELDVGKGHHGPVWSVAFSPDGRLVASGSEDGTVKLWKFGGGGSYGLWR